MIRGKLRMWNGGAPGGPAYVWKPCLIVEFLSERQVVIALDPPQGDRDGGMVLQTASMDQLRLLRTGVPL